MRNFFATPFFMAPEDHKIFRAPRMRNSTLLPLLPPPSSMPTTPENSLPRTSSGIIEVAYVPMPLSKFLPAMRSGSPATERSRHGCPTSCRAQRNALSRSPAGIGAARNNAGCNDDATTNPTTTMATKRKILKSMRESSFAILVVFNTEIVAAEFYSAWTMSPLR